MKNYPWPSLIFIAFFILITFFLVKSYIKIQKEQALFKETKELLGDDARIADLYTTKEDKIAVVWKDRYGRNCRSILILTHYGDLRIVETVNTNIQVYYPNKTLIKEIKELLGEDTKITDYYDLKKDRYITVLGLRVKYRTVVFWENMHGRNCRSGFIRDTYGKLKMVF